MRIRIARHEIRRLLGGRYEDLHRNFLGKNISGRGVDPIYQNIYYVSYLDPAGWELYRNDSPSMCDFRDGFIYCYHDRTMPARPITEVRLVHEFIHRAARFQPSIGVWSSGVVVNSAWTWVNEGLTEYLTSLVCGVRYEELVMPNNRYRKYLPAIKQIEEKIGRDELVRIYLEHDVKTLEKYVTPAGSSGRYRFR